MGTISSQITSLTIFYSKTSKLRVTGLCAVNSPETGEFPAQMASYAENVSIWWRHHGVISILNIEVKWLEGTEAVVYYYGTQIMDIFFLGMGSANERQHYNVTSSLIVWTHSQHDSKSSTTEYLLFFPYYCWVWLIKTENAHWTTNSLVIFLSLQTGIWYSM